MQCICTLQKGQNFIVLDKALKHIWYQKNLSNTCRDAYGTVDANKVHIQATITGWQRAQNKNHNVNGYTLHSPVSSSLH